MEEMVPLMREQLEQGGEVCFTPRGTSMLPMLRNGRDTVTLIQPDTPPKKYQLVFYQRDNGQYVLHRIVRVEKEGYVLRGDNQFVDETGIRREQILAVVEQFTRNGRTYSKDSLRYMLYVRVWVHTVKLRRWLRICRRKR